ncbi:MAG TPA: hypothetical protein VER12_02175 [Polyangiaceae bacterium]|nr:hypothetical protein [Polyangiaceae bacterium]
MNQAWLVRLPAPLALVFVLASACGSNDDGQTPTNTGQACQVAGDCYPGIDHSTLQGEVECLTRVPDGYCTHQCTQDQDCCAVMGECPNGFPQVCAPFESTGEMKCFLSCEAADVASAGFTDSTAFCQAKANSAFICRSTGGGSKNRKVCVPAG